jgi:Flp pilus assembly protein TadG
MRAQFPGYLQIEYSRLLLARHTARLRVAHAHGDRGASAIELAIITAILVGLAVGVLLVVQTVVTSRKTQITTNNNGIP